MPTSTDSSSTASDPRLLRAAPATGATDVALRTVLSELTALRDGRDAELATAAEAAHSAAAASTGPDAARAAVTTLLSEALALNTARCRPPFPDDLFATAARTVGVDPAALRLDLAARTLADARIAALPPATAVRGVLSLLACLAPIAYVSLWQKSDGALRCVGLAGVAGPSRNMRHAAARFFAPGSGSHGLFSLAAVPGHDDAVLVARARSGATAAVPAFLRDAARALAPALDRAAEIDRAAPSAELMANACERRLTRIGFDLHDGPVQSLAALIGDTRLLASQVSEFLAGDPRESLMRGRVGDLQARMVALEFELRCMSHSLEAPAVPCRSFERVVDHEVVAFQRQSGIRPSVDLSGDFSGMSDSQRIALLRVVQEALRNICEHSSARSVGICLRSTANGIEASVEDDGAGFDVDTTLAAAVRDGRLGLIGMMERVRLLGGRCELRSRPGGPSAVSVALPRWEPTQAVA
jgi:signal transduction histidine kinase